MTNTTNRRVIQIRVTDEQDGALRRDAQAAGMSLSDWVRFCCLQRAASTSKTLSTTIAVPTAAEQAAARPGFNSREAREARGDCGLCGSMGHTTKEHGK